MKFKKHLSTYRIDYNKIIIRLMTHQKHPTETQSFYNSQVKESGSHGLFFIKSKHAFGKFKNHDYFETNRNVSMPQKQQRANQFVGSPTPYGISNAYNYICEEIAKNYLKRPHLGSQRIKTQLNSQLQFSKQMVHLPKTNSHKKKGHLTLPNLSNEMKIMQKINITSLNQTQVQLVQKPKRQKIIYKAQQFVNLIYIDKLQSLQNVGSYDLKMNIYKYIKNTFLKSKVKYNEITQQLYDFLKRNIIQIYHTPKEYVQYKDIVNLKSIGQIFQIINDEKVHQTYKKQLIRYFFIANEETYIYQMDQIKDQIKLLINYQFNKDINNQNIYIFDEKSGEQIKNLFEMIKSSGKFIFGTETKVVMDYKNYIRQKLAQQKLVDRIKKWKSIAPNQKQKYQEFRSIEITQYHKLFTKVQKKREKMFKTKRRPTLSLKTSQFVERTKLHKDQNIFQ